MSKSRMAFGARGVLATKIVVAVSLLGVMLYSLYEWMGVGEMGVYTLLSDATKQIGNLLFDQWGVAVLITGLVLFVAMMGGVMISQEEDE